MNEGGPDPHHCSVIWPGKCWDKIRQARRVVRVFIISLLV